MGGCCAIGVREINRRTVPEAAGSFFENPLTH
jgi:hypothetical protein